jgi:hypothetical protein
MPLISKDIDKPPDIPGIRADTPETRFWGKKTDINPPGEAQRAANPYHE